MDESAASCFFLVLFVRRGRLFDWPSRSWASQLAQLAVGGSEDLSVPRWTGNHSNDFIGDGE